MTAAKLALRRKKQFEHSLEQTSSQIMTLEQQIYSIESANINKETLDAMKNAGSAMKQIHAGLTIDKVDNVMYALSKRSHKLGQPLKTCAGTSCANNTPSAKKSARPSPRVLLTTVLTKTSWTRSWRKYNKRSSTSRCSTQAACPSTTLLRAKNYHRRPIRIPRRHSGSRKTTKRRSCGSCKQKWPCKLLCLQIYPQVQTRTWQAEIGLQAYGDAVRSDIFGASATFSFFLSLYVMAAFGPSLDLHINSTQPNLKRGLRAAKRRGEIGTLYLAIPDAFTFG